jgi:site-specific DNA-methyltransferase (adenine-specific)
MKLKPYYDRDGITIYHGDCREILPTLDPVDLVLTDPPYGIAYDPSRYKTSTCKQPIAGDGKAFDPDLLLSIPADHKIIWGGNNFANQMPRGGWLCWDKRCGEQADKVLGAPFELAWVSKETSYKMKRLQHAGAKNADGEGIKRVHPTQKPVALMQWCIGLFPSKTILDPYMGSGTTLVAAKLEGRRAIGIEIEERYCEVAKERLRQKTMF